MWESIVKPGYEKKIDDSAEERRIRGQCNKHVIFDDSTSPGKNERNLRGKTQTIVGRNEGKGEDMRRYCP